MDLFATFCWQTHQQRAVQKEKVLGGCFFIGFIGLSRVYLGVHYAIDVAAGFSAGIVVLLILIRLYEWIKMLIDKTSAA